MNILFTAVTVLALTAASAGMAADNVPGSTPINVVVVTGGHDYDQKAFPRLFAGYDDIRVDYRLQKDDSELFEDISDWKYDVIVFYNMGQKIAPNRQENLKKLLDRGVGVVALHHSLAAYSGWDDWARIIGGKFFLKETQWDGEKRPQSTYLHGVDVPVHIENPDHPVTRGLKDFTLHDETYKGQWVDPQATILLTTTEKSSDRALAWAKTYSKARICTIQLGHGPHYDQPSYRRLVWQAIRWVAGRPAANP